MKRVIHWFRRDLRVTDNTALSEAARRSECVLPVFVVEEALRTAPDVGCARASFLLRSVEVIPALAQEFGAEAVFCNKRPEPYAAARDEKILHALNGLGIGFESFKDAVIWEEREVLTQAGSPFTVFTPYARAWRARKAQKPRPRLRRALGVTAAIRSEALPGEPGPSTGPEAGEQAAQVTLRRFLAGPVWRYAAQRDFPALEATSMLSPHLRVGTIGIRAILAKMAEACEGVGTEELPSAEVFRTELIWREFYQQVLFNHPHVMRGAFRPEYDRLEWSGDEARFGAWCGGVTGYPIVDAAMRCLNATGWMHNRLRMIVAMFLTKDLLVHWQWGERYFMQRLVDGDLAANNGGWQWSAGTGTDAAPYFRIFNPVSQGERFDPEGVFVRRWVPELAGLPARFLHRPWESPAPGRRLEYPERVVQHEEQRAKCLAMFKAVQR